MPSTFTVAQGRELGLRTSEMNARDWQRRHRGVRARADADWLEWAGARLRMAGPHALLALRSALRAWRIEWPGGADDGLLHVAVARPHRAPRGADVIGYSLTLAPAHIGSVEGVAVTTPARTWVDLSRVLDLPRLVAVGDRLCDPERGLCSLPELVVAVAGSPRSRGIERARQALDLVCPGAESFPESRLRVAFVRAGLPHPVVQRSIYDGIRFVARVDLLFEEHDVIVEYEGAHHATDQRQWRRDLTRIGELQRLGYIVERAHADDLADPRALIARIRTHFRRR